MIDERAWFERQKSHGPRSISVVAPASPRDPQRAKKPRTMLVLRYWEDLSVEQTAAILGCSEGNVKSQCSRSLDKLRTLLGEPFTELVGNR